MLIVWEELTVEQQRAFRKISVLAEEKRAIETEIAELRSKIWKIDEKIDPLMKIVEHLL